MVTMNTLTYAVLDYIDNLPVLILNDDICMHTCFPNINYSVVFSLLNSKKAVRIQLFTDGASIVLRKHYYTGLNHINMVFRQHVLNITTLTIISNFSVLIFLNFYLIVGLKFGPYTKL